MCVAYTRLSVRFRLFALLGFSECGTVGSVSILGVEGRWFKSNHSVLKMCSQALSQLLLLWLRAVICNFFSEILRYSV